MLIPSQKSGDNEEARHQVVQQRTTTHFTSSVSGSNFRQNIELQAAHNESERQDCSSQQHPKETL